MLPVLPFIIGGVVGTVAGIALKKYYDENEVKAAVNTKKDRLRIKFGNLKSLDKE